MGARAEPWQRPGVSFSTTGPLGLTFGMDGSLRPSSSTTLVTEPRPSGGDTPERLAAEAKALPALCRYWAPADDTEREARASGTPHEVESRPRGWLPGRGTIGIPPPATTHPVAKKWIDGRKTLERGSGSCRFIISRPGPTCLITKS